jgi:hypothetical protein
MLAGFVIGKHAMEIGNGIEFGKGIGITYVYPIPA